MGGQLKQQGTPFGPGECVLGLAREFVKHGHRMQTHSLSINYSSEDVLEGSGPAPTRAGRVGTCALHCHPSGATSRRVLTTYAEEQNRVFPSYLYDLCCYFPRPLLLPPLPKSPLGHPHDNDFHAFVKDIMT